MKNLILLLFLTTIGCSTPDAPTQNPISTPQTCQTYSVVYQKYIVGTLQGTTWLFNANAVEWAKLSKTAYSTNCNDVGKLISETSNFYTTSTGKVLIMKKTIIE